MAMKVCPTEESRMEYLLTASEMSYTHASYELAVIYRKRKNYTKALEYICRADQQMNCWYRKDFDMAGRILLLKARRKNISLFPAVFCDIIQYIVHPRGTELCIV